jgi:hypothetical protein
MAYGKVRDYLPQNIIDLQIANGGQGALDEDLEQFVNNYRQQRIGKPWSQGLDRAGTVDASRQQSLMSLMGLPINPIENAFYLPQDFQSQYGQEDTASGSMGGDPSGLQQLLGGPATTTQSGGIRGVNRWNVTLDPNATGTPGVPWNGLDENGNYRPTQVTDPGPGTTHPGPSPGIGNPGQFPPTGPNPRPLTPTNPFGTPGAGMGGDSNLSSLLDLLRSGGLPSQSYGNPTGGGLTYDEFGIPSIGQIDLPDTPLISGNFDDGFQSWFDNYAKTQADDLGQYYNTGDWPTMNGAQMNLEGIPQPGAMTPQSNSALDFLLSGKGFDDGTMSLLRGDATDNLTRSAVSDRASAKQLAQRAGLADSGAGVALEGQVNRRLSDDVARAQNQLSVQNADRGLENLRMGAPLELSRSTSGAAMQNEMALQNAARVFSGMQQNLANVQQASGLNTQNQQQRQMTRAGAQAGQRANLGSMFGGATIDRRNMADTTNAANQINRGLNQGQLNRQRDLTNANFGENRFGLGLNAGLSLINGSNPQGYALGGANSANQYQPNLFGAQGLTGGGNAALNTLLGRLGNNEEEG